MNNYYKILLASISFLNLATANTNANNDIGAGQFYTVSDDQKITSALLLDSEAHINITGMSARVDIKQRFKNTSSQWVEGNYIFPLSENAAVDAMTMIIGKRKIIGEIQEKQVAKQTYETAKKTGKKTALLSFNRDNLFTVNAANIEPNGVVEIHLSYIQSVDYQDGVFSLRLPTTYTPRYISSKQTINDDEVSLQSNLPVQSFSQAANNKISIHATINTGFLLDNVTSTSHNISWTTNETDELINHVSLHNNLAAMDKDFLLSWEIIDSEQPHASIFNEITDKANYASIILMPPQESALSPTPRETIFIIDTSGSMSGEAMRQARLGLLSALDYLDTIDTFNIIEFNNEMSQLFSSSVEANDINIVTAKEFVRNLVAGGGTEMFAPIQAALTNPSKDGYLKQVVFITDGSVSNEQALFQLIQNKLGKSRFFTVGIGSAPNSFFMRRAAEIGRGTFSYITDTNEVEKQISNLFNKLQSPALKDIQIEFPAGVTAEFFPNPLPDLYLGEPVIVQLKTDQLVDGVITISGEVNGMPWQDELHIDEAKPQQDIAKLWAKSKIQNLEFAKLMGEDIDHVTREITQLGLDYQLATEFTSFVAVEQVISKPNDAALHTKNVANQYPAGMDLAFPATATSSTLSMLLGLVLLFIAGFSYVINRWVNYRYQEFNHICTDLFNKVFGYV